MRGIACFVPLVIVIGVYAAIALDRPSELGAGTAREAYYNLLVDGFRSGSLGLAREVPAGLAALKNPYDPKANSEIRGDFFTGVGRLHDVSYFNGRLYLYFGVTPALLLFWPVAALTGHYVSHQQAVFIFASIGFLAGAALLAAIRRRCLPSSSLVSLIAAVCALGLATGMPILLERPDVWEVPIACGGALLMLALLAVWRAVNSDSRGVLWTALASAACGGAVGARPNLLFASVVVLVPVVAAWRRAPAFRLLLASVIPIVCIGLGIAAYNHARFGSFTEFGQTYQLAGDTQQRQVFGLGHLWFNLKVYFVSIASWGGSFPFVNPIVPPEIPAGHGGVENPYGVLTNMPFALLAFVVPFEWRRLSAGARTISLCIGAVFVAVAAPVCLYYGTCQRYETEFTPYLVLLGGVGLLAAEAGIRDSVSMALLVRVCGAVLALGSVGFNLLASLDRRAYLQHDFGQALFFAGRYDEAVRAIESSVAIRRVNPGGWVDLAVTRLAAGHVPEARVALEIATSQNPAMEADYAAAFDVVRRRFAR